MRQKNCNNQVFSVKWQWRKDCAENIMRGFVSSKRREQNPVHRLNEALPRKIKGPKSKKN